MKEYPKLYEDLYSNDNPHIYLDRIGSTLGSAEVLRDRFRAFYYDAHRQVFGLIVKEVWLEQQFTYRNIRRTRRKGNGFFSDRTFGYFMKNMVGVSQKPISLNFCFAAISTYLKDFFPDFLKHDPFLEPDYFEFPYKNVFLDHMVLVYTHHDRLEMLQKAENESLSYADFANWAINQSFCYNDEVGKTVYVLTPSNYMWPHIKNITLKADWKSKCFDFEPQQPRESLLKSLPEEYNR